ncbi:MAG TPA: hypothetical protein VGK90_13605 [Rhizomicrobium sp.]|jgi:hypothetical protein
MSDKPIAERLQVKKGRRLAILSAPRGVDALIGAADARAKLADADVLLVFAKDGKELKTRFADLERAPQAAILWLAYPKLTSKLAGDLNRDMLHEAAIAHGLDTVSQIAIDEDWTALRFKRVSQK